jgi:hypothetical protein
MRFTFQNIGWKSKVMQKRATFSISINKNVAMGCSIEKGQELFCYLAKDQDGRPVMMVYLDEREKCKGHIG